MNMVLLITSLIVLMAQIVLFIIDIKTGRNKYTPLIILLGSIVVGVNVVRIFTF